MSDPNCRYLEPVRAIAKQAGALIRQIYQDDFAVEHKADGSPLTLADRAAHQHILAELGRLSPQIPVLSEEAALIDYAQRQHWPCFWLVDPLDGTKEFVQRNGQFTVNIALIEGHQAVLGVVYAPISDVSYFACRASGAYRQQRSAPAEAIHVRRYHGGKAAVVASRAHAGERVGAFVQRLARKEGQPELLSMGSSLKLCLVAAGQADIYPRLAPTSEWDTAAAQCVVEAAGGSVLDLEAQTLIYNKPNILNPEFMVIGDTSYPWMELLYDN